MHATLGYPGGECFLAVPDTINLPAGTYTLAILGAGEAAAATGDLNINGLGGALTITGAGAATTIIDGGGLDGVFQIQAGTGANVTIQDVTIRNGNNIGGLGGGIHVGNGTTLTLNRSVVTANKAGGAAPGAGGRQLRDPQHGHSRGNEQSVPPAEGSTTGRPACLPGPTAK